MNIKGIIVFGVLTACIMLASVSPSLAARHRHHRTKRVVVKHKVVHHRHRVGLRHIGRGTRVKTHTKVETR